MLHGRRKGKKLRSYQSGLISGLLPGLRIDISSGNIDPRQIFPDASQIVLEIGFGGGEHLAFRAGQNLATGFLGCEPFVNGAAKLLALIDENALGNVRLHVGDAGEIIARLPAASVNTIYLLYPDPWPKRRQRKRRFVSDVMLAELARILVPGGELRFATDIDDYAGWVLARILRSNDFVWSPKSCLNWLEPWHGWPGTRYETKARLAGRPSCYLSFVRPSS